MSDAEKENYLVSGPREFNKVINRISSKKKGVKYLDVNKIGLLTDDTRTRIVQYLVRKRWPIVKDLIPEGFGMDWLACCGYLYETTGKQYTFVHTCEHSIK